MGWATQRGPRPRLVATSHRLASCVIVSRFRTALDLDTYPLSNFIRPRCAERAKPGRGKPVLIMHIGFLACFHAISLERSRFSKIARQFHFRALVALKMLVSLISRLVACSARIVVDRQTDRHTERLQCSPHSHIWSYIVHVCIRGRREGGGERGRREVCYSFNG